MMSVLVCGLSIPLSMIVVATSTSISAPRIGSMNVLDLARAHLPVSHAPRASGAASSTRATASSIVVTRLDT